MSLGGLVRRLLGVSVGSEGSGRPEDNRSLERFHLRDPRVASLTVGGADGRGGETAPLREVSYGALSAFLRAPRGEMRDGRLPARLTVLGESVTIALKPVRSAYEGGKPFTAFMMLHDSPESLIFLRELLEPLRRGLSLLPISQGVIAEKYRGGQWECLRGDGPTDLVVRMSEDSRTLEEALLIYRVGDRYAELAFIGQKIATRFSLDNDGAWSRMAATVQPDAAVVRFGACLMAGLDDGIRRRLAPMMDACRRELETRTGQGAA